MTKVNYQILSDDELVTLLKTGDHNSFTEIFSRYYILLFSFANRRLNDKELAKDLIHDSFATIWEKRLTINIQGELAPFLFKVIKNRILDSYKHKKISDQYITKFQEHLDNNQNNTDHLVRYNDLLELIEKEIAALPEKMRIVFELSRKTAMNRKEISEYLNLPENTVKTNIHRALKILRSKLQGSTFFNIF